MKLFVKLLLALLVIGMLLPFTLLKGRDGKPMMSFSDIQLPDFSIPDLPELPSINATQTSDSQGESLAGKDVFYKWLDSEGNIQFTTTPPPEGVEYTLKGYDPNTNVIQAVKPIAEEPEQDESAQADKQISSTEEVGNPYSPEKVEKLFDDAKNIEKLLNDRLKNQEALIGQ